MGTRHVFVGRSHRYRAKPSLASVHKSLRFCDLCKELAFGAPNFVSKVSISYNSFAFSVFRHQFLEKSLLRNRLFVLMLVLMLVLETVA
jgi:hypothetical protein